MNRIITIALVLVSYIEAESQSLPCRSVYCNCDQTTSEISWECVPPSSIFLEPNTQRHYIGENVPDDYLDVGIERSVGLKLMKDTSTLEVDCSNFVLTNTTISADIFDYLPNLSIGPLNTVKFRFCPLPKESFQSFITKLNITELRSLLFSHSLSNISVLSPPYFDSLPTVDHISFTDNSNVTRLHADLFRTMTQLKNLNFRENSIAQIDSETFQNLPKLKILDLGDNHITKLNPDVFRELPSLKILNIDNNILINLLRIHFSNLPNLESLSISGNNISVLPPDVFSDLKSLRKLHANKNKFQTLPRDLFANTKMLTEIRISYHKNSLVELPSGLFSNLPELTTVVIQESGIKELPADLFWNSTKLMTLTLTGHKKMTSLPRELFKDLTRLSKLDLSNGKLKTIPEHTFISLRALKSLDLSRNRIEEITNGLFTGLNSLEDLDLSHNQLKVISFEAFDQLTALTKVDLSYNLLKFPTNVTYSPLKLCTSLKEIFLSDNYIDAIYNDWYISMTSLETLDLKRNNFTDVPPELFYSIVSSNLTVDLSSNQISFVDLRFLETYIRSQDESKSSRSGYKNKIILDSNPLLCNCSNVDLVAFLDNIMHKDVYDRLDIDTNNVSCGDVNIKDFPLDSVHCNVSDKCPESCSCTYWPSLCEMNVNCSSALLTEMPQVIPDSFPGFSEYNNIHIRLSLNNNSIARFLEQPSESYALVSDLDLSYNRLSDVNNIGIQLPHLKKLDLSYNNLSSISQDFLRNLSSTLTQSSLALYGNPWECNCSIDTLHSFVLNKHTFLINSEKIICDGESKPLNQMTVKDFCAPFFDQIVPVLAALGTLGFLFGILIAMYYRYEHEVKVWLFAHKLLLWLFREDMDSDKEYDAFVSFSNEDEDYVTHDLIPGLEKNFKICYHMRDFLPGHWIHTQIEECIQKSRRTIIVLSENFLKSQWALHEFRTAHAQSVEDNCSRVIILIYGDMPSQETMEPEMKAYMKTHTYIKASDDWFWNKLRYALPHGTSKPTDKVTMTPISNLTITINPDFLESSKIHSSEIMKQG